MKSTGDKLIALGRVLTVLCVGATTTVVVLSLLQQEGVRGNSYDAALVMFVIGALAVISAFTSWTLAFIILRRADVALDDRTREFWKNAIVLLAFIGAWCFLLRVKPGGAHR